MFFRRSVMRQRIVSNRSRSHSKPRGLRTTKFESLETRQMFDGSSILPMESEPTSTLMVQEANPIFSPSLLTHDNQTATLHVASSTKDVIPPAAPIALGTFDARTLLPYIEQDNVQSLRPFPWLTHLDRQIASPAEQLRVRGFSGNEKISQLFGLEGHGESISDSFWIDFDLPVKTTADGRSFKPLFAFHVENLDVDIRKAVETLFAGGVRVAAGDVNGDGRTDVLAVWNPLDINPGSTPPGVWTFIPAGVIEPVLPALRELGRLEYPTITFLILPTSNGEQPIDSLSFNFARVQVAIDDVNGDGRADLLAVWNPLDINPGSTPPGVWSLNHLGGTKPVDPSDPSANGPEPFRPPFIDGPHVTPSGPTRPGSGPFGPNGPNGPEPYRRWEVGPDGELYPLGEGPAGSTPQNPPPVEPGAGKKPPAPRDPNSVPTGPERGPFGPNGPNGPEPYRLWKVGPDGELYPLGEGPEGSTPVPAPPK